MIDRFERFTLAIFEISRYWHKLAAAEMEKYGLKGAHATYLTTLYRYEEGVTVPQLCELCGKDKSDASRMIAILEQKMLVKKQSVNQSLYRGRLKLTQEGRAAAEQVCKKVGLTVEMAGKDLTEETRNIFYQALESISGNLKEISMKGLLQQ